MISAVPLPPFSVPGKSQSVTAKIYAGQGEGKSGGGGLNEVQYTAQTQA